MDVIVYSTSESAIDFTNKRTPIFSDNGNFVTLVRVGSIQEIPDGVDILATDEGACPFSKLSGASLTKYNLAYPRPIENFTTPAGASRTYQREFIFGKFA